PGAVRPLGQGAGQETGPLDPAVAEPRLLGRRPALRPDRLAGQVHDGVDALQRLPVQLAGGGVPADGVGPGGATPDGDDGVTVGAERFGQSGTDEAARSGDGDAHEIPLVVRWLALRYRRTRAAPRTRGGPAMFQEFKKFLMRGNVVDLAVAVVIGAAFGAVVTSLVDGIINPIVGLVGGKDLSGWVITLKEASGS